MRAMAERKARRHRQLEQELAALQAITLEGPTTEETWGEYATQEVRDQMAASALIHERLRHDDALRRLGFRFNKDKNGHVTQEEKDTSRRIFTTPGCQALVKKITDSVVDNEEQYVIRLNQAAMSDDDATAIRAIEALAKLGGLNKEKPVAPIDARTQNLFLIGQKVATKAALEGAKELQAGEFLNYEPLDEPVRIFDVAEGEA